MPQRDFISAITIAALADLTINSTNNLYCAGTTWLLPESGDDGARFAGQPIITEDPNARVTDNVQGWSMWNPQSTMLGLSVSSPPPAASTSRVPRRTG